MDLSQKEALPGEMNKEGIIKCCADCKITKTPLWRGGPSGPKSLCNACGIRHRKKRSAKVGVTKGKDKRREKISTAAATNSSATASGGGGGDSSCSSSGKNSCDGKSRKNGELSEDLRVRLMTLGNDLVVLQRRQRSPMKRQRSSKKLGEVEQAAVLLMALSCGSVFA